MKLYIEEYRAGVDPRVEESLSENRVESGAAGSLLDNQLKGTPAAAPRPARKSSPSVWKQQSVDCEGVTSRLRHVTAWHWCDHFWNGGSCSMSSLKKPVDKLERVQGRVTRMIALLRGDLIIAIF